MPEETDEQLTGEQDRVFGFERTWQGRDAYKDSDIFKELDMMPTRFYQLLLQVIGTERAYKTDPHLVTRLRRRLERRTQFRWPGRRA